MKNFSAVIKESLDSIIERMFLVVVRRLCGCVDLASSKVVTDLFPWFCGFSWSALHVVIPGMLPGMRHPC